MDLTSTIKAWLLFAAIWAGGINPLPTVAEDFPKPLFDTGNDRITGVEDLARLTWAVLNAIEREHLASPERGTLVEVLAQVLTESDEGPELDAVVADVNRCQTADAFTDWMRQFWTSGRKPIAPLDQLPDRIIQALQSKVGHLQLVRNKDSIVQEQLRNNRYVGIGVNVNSHDGILMFPVIRPGGPADRAGLRNGTRVAEIDGRSTRDISIDTAVDWIRGPAGMDVILKVTDAGPNTESRNVTLKRGVVRFDSVVNRDHQRLGQGTILSEKSDGIGWICLDNITSSTLSELRAAEARARIERVRVLILDFRATSESDSLYQAEIVADGLVDGATLWYRTEHGQSPRPCNADRECLFRGIHLVILLHQHTCSALSSIAAALQDANRATVVGDAPAFRGTFTSTIKLADVPFTLEMTTAKLTRARRDRQWPIEPDHAVRNPGAAAANLRREFETPNEHLSDTTKHLEDLLQPGNDVSALQPANVRRGIFSSIRTLKNQMEQAFPIEPKSLIQYPNAEEIAERVAQDLLQTLPEVIID